MSGRLRSRLLAVGRAAGNRSESGGIRFFALALASLTLAASLAAAIAALAVETARADRMADGQLTPATTATPAAETTMVALGLDHLRGGRQFTVVYLSPGGEDAPLPPGLDEWPRPGTAVISPELLREGAAEEVTDRYGGYAGTIDPSGLADATELLAYVRPAQHLTPEQYGGVVAVAGFGTTGAVTPMQNLHWLLADQDFLIPNVLAGLVLAVGVVPSLLLALVASRVASHSRDRRDALITALGGRMPHRLWVALGEAWGPVALGGLGAIAAMAWFLTADRRLPGADYVVSASDLRGLWWAFALSAVAAAGFVLSAAVFQSAVGSLRMVGNRPLRKLGRGTRLLRAALFPCFVAFAALSEVLLPDLAFGRAVVAFAGLVGTVLTMPAAIGVGISSLGRALAKWGRRRRRPALLASGARMAFRPDAIARQVFGVCASILFLLFTLTTYGNFAVAAEEADAIVDAHGYSLVEVRPRAAATAAEVAAFVDAVPADVEMIAYEQSTDESGGAPVTHLRLTGTCAALERLDLPCPAAGEDERVEATEGALGAWADWTAFGDEHVLTVASGEPSSAVGDRPIVLLAFTAGGGEVEAGVLSNAGSVFPLGVSVSGLGDSSATGAVPPLEQAGWMTLIGGFGLAVLVFATGLGLTAEFLRFGRSIAPLSVLAGNRGIYWRAAALVSLVPLAVAVLGGFLIGSLVMRPMTVSSVDLITPTFIAVSCSVALAAGLVMWTWSATAAVNAANHWRPGRGDD